MWCKVFLPLWKDGFSPELTRSGDIRIEPELYVTRKQLRYLADNEPQIRRALSALSIEALAADYARLRSAGGVLSPVFVMWQLHDGEGGYQLINLEGVPSTPSVILREAMRIEVLQPEGVPDSSFSGSFPHDWAKLAQNPRIKLHLIRCLTRFSFNSSKARAALRNEIQSVLGLCGKGEGQPKSLVER